MMRSSIVALLFTILVSQEVVGQSYPVLEAKKATTSNGRKIKKGQSLNKSETVTILAKGYLILDVESEMDLKLAPGSHNIYTEAKRHNAWYAKHVSLTGLLKRKGLLTCKFRYKTLVVPGSDKHYEVDRIEVDQKGLVTFTDDTTALKIKWANPDYRYKGGYLIIVRDLMNNGFIDVLETKENTITMYPGKYDHEYIFYSILAEDCRASLRYRVNIKRSANRTVD